jgi:peptidoglycan/LPS O-acetylase OafA/YrhL
MRKYMILLGLLGLGMVITLPYVIKAFFSVLLWMMVQPLPALMCIVFVMCIVGGREILLKKVPNN